jgi:hypothetical protein
MMLLHQWNNLKTKETPHFVLISNSMKIIRSLKREILKNLLIFSFLKILTEKTYPQERRLFLVFVWCWH